MIYSKYLKSEIYSDKHIIFFHGGPGLVSHEIYRKFWDKFNSNHNIHYLDYRNHGLSSDYDSFSLEDIADDYFEYINNIDEKDIKIYLAGVSLGGWVILEFMSKYYETLKPKIHKLIICNSEHRVCKDSIINNYTNNYPIKTLEVIKEMFSDNLQPDIGKRYIENCVCGVGKSYTPDDFAKCVPRFNYDLFYYFYKNKMYDINYTSQISKFNNVELLNIIGSRDPEHDYKFSLELSSLFTNATTKIYPCGAPCYGFYPDDVLNDIQSFLERK